MNNKTMRGITMTLDKSTVQRMIRLPDDQLAFIIRRLGKEAGVDLSGVSLDKAQLDTLRSALAIATDEDIARATELLSQLKHQ